MNSALFFRTANFRRYFAASLCILMLFSAFLPSHIQAGGSASQLAEATWSLQGEPAETDPDEWGKIAGDVCGLCKQNIAPRWFEAELLIVTYSNCTSFVPYPQNALISCVLTLPAEPPRT